MHEIMTIFRKEMMDTLRDRRTLFVMVVLNILLTPALIVGLNQLQRATANNTIHVAVGHGSTAPALVRLIEQQPHIAVSTSNNVVGDVKDGKVDAGVIIAPTFGDRVASGTTGRVTIVSNSTQFSSQRAADAVTAALGSYRLSVVTERLQAKQINPAILNPIDQVAQDVASKQALAGFLLSLIVPMFLVVYAMGGMYTAMDGSAGEKERFTLEALLLSPATKLQITLGKLLAVTTVALSATVLGLISFFTAMKLFPLNGSGAPALSLPPSTIALIALLGILLSVGFSALELALGVMARSFKEAQSYITPLYLVAFIPTVALSSIPGFKPTAAFFVIPAVNAVLVFKEALLGTPDAGHIALTIISMALFCALCLAVTLRIFRDERVLLRA